MTKIKKGDNVVVISGKDKGKSGKVVRIFSDKNKIVVEGINMIKKHVRPKRQGQKGQVVQMPSPLDWSNVMIVCSECNKKTRVGFQLKNKEGVKNSRAKIRICKRCQKEL